MADAVARVSQQRAAAAGAGEEFFAEGEVVVALHIHARASLINDNAWRAQMI